jgi:glucoamylase
MKLFVHILIVFNFSSQVLASEASGGPGSPNTYNKAQKVQIGTFAPHHTKTPVSLVWFTNVDGILSEVYYPTIDQLQIKDAQFLITDGQSLLEEKKDLLHKVEVLSPSLVKLTNSDPLGRFKIEKIFYTLKNSSTLVEKVTLTSYLPNISFYHLVNSHLNNTSMKDTALVTQNGVLFKEKQTQLKVTSTLHPEKISVGFYGINDGYQDLFKDLRMDHSFTKALNGNVVSLMKIPTPLKQSSQSFFITYEFNNKIKTTENLEFALKSYEQAWGQYLATLKTPASLNQAEKNLYLRSLYTLKVHEDKLNPGAIIASLSIPWGDERIEYNDIPQGGYRLIWPRDLYHSSLALVLAGDLEAGISSLRFLKKIQYQTGTWNFNGRVIAKKGAFPQNVWTDGREYWSSLQIDQTAFPVLLLAQVFKRASAEEKELLIKEFKEMAYSALNFIQSFGPWSAQERWEENHGISPSSFASAATALLVAENIFGKNNSTSSFKKTANDWILKPNDNIETWTITTNGPFSDGEYYLRMSGCNGELSPWDPNAEVACPIANGRGYVDQRKIVDQGFLQLSLFGLKSARDEKIQKSLKVVNDQIRVKTPHGYGWYRYSFDAYGEQKQGRLWPLLSSEHARFEIENFRAGLKTWDESSIKIKSIMKTMQDFANDGQMIPEQVFESTGEGTGAATPLAWSHAEWIKLVWSYELKKNVDLLIDHDILE